MATKSAVVKCYKKIDISTMLRNKRKEASMKALKLNVKTLKSENLRMFPLMRVRHLLSLSLLLLAANSFSAVDELIFM